MSTAGPVDPRAPRAASVLIGVAGAAQRAVSAVRTIVTPLGFSVLFLTAIWFAAGYGFGWVELVAMAWAGLSVLIVAAVHLGGREPLDVQLTVEENRIVVGTAASVRLAVANPTRFRSSRARLEVPIGAAVSGVTLPALSAGGTFLASLASPVQARGVYAVGPIRSVRRDPLGLVRRQRHWSAVSTLVVHPRTVALPAASRGQFRDLDGRPVSELTSSDISFHALREYTPGDEPRHIHWKSTARTGTPMVRQFEQTRRSRLVVALSLASGDFADDDEFELAVGAAASIGVRAIRHSGDVDVVVGDRGIAGIRRLSTSRSSRLLDDLSAVDLGVRRVQIVELARATASVINGTSVAYLVCGSLPGARELRSASAHFPPAVETVAIVCDRRAVPGRRRVGSLSILTIGSLGDLATALAKAAAS